MNLTVLSSGLALFSMFFGAGNLIFPLIIGRLCGSEAPMALLGLGLSAVVFPLLGLMAMMLYSGNIHVFLARIGKWPALITLLILQLSQGPSGILPRLITLMHATVKMYFPSVSLAVFSIAICSVVFLLTFRPKKVVDLLGVILTPVLILILAFLILFGWIYAPDAVAGVNGSLESFNLGLKMGYQTTDLIAALLFASLILPHLSQGTQDPKLIQKRMVYASLIASLLLMSAYIGLCYLAAHHSLGMDKIAPEELLHQISVRVLGSKGAVVSAGAVFLACLTTAMSLSMVFAQYLKKDLFRDKVNLATSLSITSIWTALMANLGFSGIVKVWEPILTVLYPALIILCLYNIVIWWKSASRQKQLQWASEPLSIPTTYEKC